MCTQVDISSLWGTLKVALKLEDLIRAAQTQSITYLFSVFTLLWE